ncbi:acetate/propionate family kinase [Legionella impletisoli]|uniref:Acetate kinase n=1 Tax=Legionella impletisoli TaxID=343510 RepID=A0A917N948_9GAMM|nr:acetate/propionate family kinase [Legionella impletisoli]GGI78018.1 acetate kinase [Legionella impletisoli]
MTENILTCNAGSNSLKCALYEAGKHTLAWRFEVDRIHDEATLSIKDKHGEKLKDKQSIDSGYKNALFEILTWCEEQSSFELVAAGHRIVHGGLEFKGPVEINESIMKKLKALIPLAPLHQPHNLILIDCLSEKYPNLKQVACFDTAFHRTQPWLAQQYALPRELVHRESILRYGFHGLSYEYIASILPEYIGSLENSRVIIAHLGSGASMCALKNGKSVSTTMGFTALEGLMMSTRCGQLDPGIVLYLQQEKEYALSEIDTLLYERSGLLGVSGISGDMRDLEDSDDAEANEAIELFCYMAAKELGSLIMTLGGMDAFVFTGAMGCNDVFVRRLICNYMDWFGVSIQDDANANHSIRISTPASSIPVLVLPTDEEEIIAKQTAGVL